MDPINTETVNQPTHKNIMAPVALGILVVSVLIGGILFMNRGKITTNQTAKVPQTTTGVTQAVQPNKLNLILGGIAMKELGKGVYAKSKDNASSTIVIDKQVEWKVYTYTVNGKQITIKVPNNETPPTQEMVEVIYK